MAHRAPSLADPASCTKDFAASSAECRQVAKGHEQQQQHQEIEEAWRRIYSCMQFYQSFVMGEVEKLVERTGKPLCYGDMRVRELAAEAALQSAFQRMHARVDRTKSRDLQQTFRHPEPFSFASILSLVSTQNRFVRDELVAKLGIVDRTGLEIILPVSRDSKQRAIVSNMLERAATFTETSGGGGGGGWRSGGWKSGGGHRVVGPVDFSDPDSDERWEAELERARKEVELVIAREEAETKALVSVAETRMCGVHEQACRTANERRWEIDDAPPRLLSESDSDYAVEDDGDEDSAVSGGAYTESSGKLEAPARKRGNVGGKGNSVSPSAPLARVALPRSFTPDHAEAGAVSCESGVDATAGATGGGLDDEHMKIKGWVEDVAAGRVAVRAGHLQRYFRGRIDAPIISVVLENFANDVPAAVVACAEMLVPPITISPSQNRAGANTTPSVDSYTSDGGGQAGRHGGNDNDVDECDICAIVSRANSLLETGCQDAGRLQALLEKAKHKEGLNTVRKKLKKAIKALAQQEEETRDLEGKMVSREQEEAENERSDRNNRVLRDAVGSNGIPVLTSSGSSHVTSAIVTNELPSSCENALGRDSDVDADRDGASDGGDSSSSSGGSWGGGGSKAYNSLYKDGRPVAGGAHDDLIRHAEQLVANGCQDVKKLTALLHRARGKIGLDKTRRILKKAIKESTATAGAATAMDGAPGTTFHSAQPNNRTSSRKNNSGKMNGNSRNSVDDNDNDHDHNHDKRDHINAKKDSALLGISRSVSKQLDKQLKRWPTGHVRQILRCRPGLVPRILGPNGTAVNIIVEKSGAKVDVLKDATNDRNYRAVTVRGVPKSVSHAVRLLCKAIGDSVIVGEVEECGSARRYALSVAKPPGPHSMHGGGSAGAATSNTPTTINGKNISNTDTIIETTTHTVSKTSKNRNTDKQMLTNQAPAATAGTAARTGFTNVANSVVSSGDAANVVAAFAAADAANADAANAGAYTAPTTAAAGRGECEAVFGAGFIENDGISSAHQQGTAPTSGSTAPADFGYAGDSVPARHQYPLATTAPPSSVANGSGDHGHHNCDFSARSSLLVNDDAPEPPAYASSGGPPGFANLGGVRPGGTAGAHSGGVAGSGASVPPGFSGASLGPAGLVPAMAEHTGASTMGYACFPPVTFAGMGTYDGARRTPGASGHVFMNPVDAGIGTFATSGTTGYPFMTAGGDPLAGTSADAGAIDGSGTTYHGSYPTSQAMELPGASTAAPATLQYPYGLSCRFPADPDCPDMNTAAAPQGFTPVSSVGGTRAALATTTEGNYEGSAPETVHQPAVEEQPNKHTRPTSPADSIDTVGRGAPGGEGGEGGEGEGKREGGKEKVENVERSGGISTYPSECNDDLDSAAGGSGVGLRGEARTCQQLDPHVEAVLKAAKCERFLPLFVARRIDLRKLALMEDEDFMALEDEKDANTRLARGPQLKIIHHCKRKMKELGMEIELDKEGRKGEEKNRGKNIDNKCDSEGKCHICWEKEIQVVFCPCGHEACCIDCGKAIAGGPCPICRVPVELATRSYKG